MSQKTTRISLSESEAMSKLKIGIFLQSKDSYWINYLHIYLEGNDEPVTYDRKEMRQMAKLTLTEIEKLFKLVDEVLNTKIVKYELELITPKGDNDE